MTTSAMSDDRAANRAEAFRAWPISDVESVFLLDRDGRVVAAGPRAEILLRRRHDELTGERLEDLLDGGPRFTAFVRRADAEATLASAPAESLYVTEALPDGRLRALHVAPSLGRFLGDGDEASLNGLFRRVHRADLARVGAFHSSAA